MRRRPLRADGRLRGSLVLKQVLNFIPAPPSRLCIGCEGFVDRLLGGAAILDEAVQTGVPVSGSRHYARAAELNLPAATAMKSAFVELLPQFEQDTDHRVTVEYGTTAKFRPRIEGFEPFDVAVIVQAVTEELVRSGRLLQEPRPVIGVTVATLVYKSDAPKPEIATPEALKSTLLSAAKMSLSDPALGGTSSI